VQAIRRLLQSAFGLLSLIYITATYSTFAHLQYFLASLKFGLASDVFQDATGLRRLTIVLVLALGMLIRCAPFPLLALYSTAWWTLRKGKPSARAWALAASIITALQGIPFLLLTIRYWSQIHGILGSGLMVLIGASLLVGIPGIIVFAPRNAALHQAVKQPERVKGDGTSRNMDRFAILLQVAVILVGGQLGWHWTSSRYDHRIPRTSGWLLLLAEIAAIVILHELGHIVAGLFSGMKLCGVLLGPLHFYQLNGKWKLRFELHFLRGAAGGVGMIPRTPYRDRKGRIWFIAGGPIASLLSGIVFLCLATTIPVGQSPALWDFYAWTGILSLSAFVLNVIPVRSLAFYSDGAKIFQVLTRSVLDDYNWVLTFSNSLAVTPNRPRNYDLEALRRVLDSPVGQPQRAVFCLMESECLLDRGLFTQSAESVARAQAAYEQKPEKLTAGTISSFVYGHGILRDDAATARIWAERLTDEFGFDPEDGWLCSAAIACAEGSRDEAENLLNRFDGFQNAKRTCGLRDFNLYLSHVIREKLAGGFYSPGSVLPSVAAPAELQAQPAY